MDPIPSYTFFPLGDSAITLDFGNIIDESINRRVITLYNHLQKNSFPGMIEALPAFSSLTVYYDTVLLRKLSKEKSAYEQAKQKLDEVLGLHIETNSSSGRFMRIPLCYEKEFGPDLESIAGEKKITVDEIIRLHNTKKYRVYMLGFLPGFAYMGQVDEKIAVPRLNIPRQKVSAGSVGIAGKQTGIYPLDSPGGWRIIGRTPLKLFEAFPEHSQIEKESSLSLLQPGDEVEFYPISRDEFENYQSRDS